MNIQLFQLFIYYRGLSLHVATAIDLLKVSSKIN